jgi:hypothetical protein
VASTIWRRVRLGSLNLLFKPVLIIAYIRIFEIIFPETHEARIISGTLVNPIE